MVVYMAQYVLFYHIVTNTYCHSNTPWPGHSRVPVSYRITYDICLQVPRPPPSPPMSGLQSQKVADWQRLMSGVPTTGLGGASCGVLSTFGNAFPVMEVGLEVQCI